MVALVNGKLYFNFDDPVDLLAFEAERGIMHGMLRAFGVIQNG